MNDSFFPLGDSDTARRMVSVSSLLLMREQQSQCSSHEHDKDSLDPGLKMSTEMQIPNEVKHTTSTTTVENDEEEQGQHNTSTRKHVECDEAQSYPDSGGDDDGESPLRIVVGSTPNPTVESDTEDPNEDDDKERYDDEEQQLLQYQQRKLQMHQDLTAYNTGSLTVTRFPLNGYPSPSQQSSADRCSTGGKYSVVVPNTNANRSETNAASSPNNNSGCRTGLPFRDRGETISSPPLNYPTSPSYFNNNNNNNIPNNNSGMMKSKGLGGVNTNGHSQIQDEEEKCQRYNHSISHSHGQKRHINYNSQQAGFGLRGQGSDRKSQQGSFPVIPDIKPDSLGAQSQLNTLSRSIGNALLNLASLGSLASLQDQQQQQLSPNLSPLVNSGNQYGGSSSNMTPLNLTNAGSFNPNPNPMTNNTNYLNQYINSHQHSNLYTKGGTGNFPQPQPGSSSSPPNGLSGNTTLPQLILASGNIVQGIQGAQLLIPTAQGLMTQTILTIPITQPVSPSSLLSPTPPGKTRPPSAGPQCPTSTSIGVNPLLNHLNPLLVNQSQQSNIPGSAPMSSHTHNISNNSAPEKLGMHDRNLASGLNLGLNRIGNGRAETGTNISVMTSGHSGSGGQTTAGTICANQKMSPCSSHSQEDHDSDFDFDRGSDNDDSDQMVDGINLDEIKEFAKAFKLRRLSLGLTQTQVGQALSVTEGPAYSQSAICSALAWQMAQSKSYRTSIPQSSMFEKLDITPKSAQKIKPVLERWMKEAEDRFKNGHQTLHEFVGMEPSKKRKRRTSFTPQALEILNTHFERNTHPSGAEITTLAHQLGYEREVIRIWFCNKRQALKNTVRMMSKGSSPM